MKISYSAIGGIFSASEAATGYDAANLANSAVGRAWRSTTTGTVTADIDLGASVTVETLFVHETNCSSISVLYGTTTPPGTSGGSITTAEHVPTGRRSGRIYLGVTARYLRLTFSGTPTDGAGYWTAGAVHVFGQVLTLDRAPLLGAQLTITHPRGSKKLANGRMVVWDTGLPLVNLRGRFAGINDTTTQQAIRRAKTGTVLVDIEAPSRSDLVWPMQQMAADNQITINDADEMSFNWQEIA